MGLSFFVSGEVPTLPFKVRWGGLLTAGNQGGDGKPLSVWQRSPREESIALSLTGDGDPQVHQVPGSGGLQLHVVERSIATDDLDGHIPQGTRSVSVFL